MVQTPAKPITLEEFLKLPETEPASEYIDGQIIQKEMPQGKHSAINTDLPPAINQVVKTQKVARAFVELRCTFEGRSIVPDISVFAWNRISRDDGKIANVFRAAPDWMIEILSPEQRQTKIIKKILHCFEHGTQMAWIVDPDEETIFVYRAHEVVEFFDLEAPDELLPVPEFAKDLRLSVGEIFAWLSE